MDPNDSRDPYWGVPVSDTQQSRLRSPNVKAFLFGCVQQLAILECFPALVTGGEHFVQTERFTKPVV